MWFTTLPTYPLKGAAILVLFEKFATLTGGFCASTTVASIEVHVTTIAK